MEKNVSVIIPTYNRRELLRAAMESVLNQTYPYIEVVVVDDGSSDNTADLVAQYSGKAAGRIVYLRQENRGPAAARNRGLAAASHDLIAFLDSDDRFDPGKIEVQVAAMNSDPDCLISHTREIWYRRGVLLNQKKKHEKSRGDIFARCLQLCAVSMSTVMLRRQLIDEVGLFDEQFPCCEDYDYWLRASIGHRFSLIDQSLTVKQGGRPDQVSFRHRTGMDRYRIRAIEKILQGDLLDSAQRSLAVQELARKCRIYGNGCRKYGRPAEAEFYFALPRRYGFSDLGV